MNVRYFEKAKKIEKIFQFDLVRKRQNLVNVFKECPLMSDLSVRFFQIQVAFSEYLNYIKPRLTMMQQLPIFVVSLILFSKVKLRICLFSLFVHTNSTINSSFLFVLDGFPKEIFLFVFYGLQGRDLIKQARRRPLIVMLLFFKAKTPKG